MKKNEIEILIQISFFLFIPLIKIQSQIIKLKVNNTGTVKILNKEKITNTIMVDGVAASITGNVITVDNKEGEITLSWTGTISNCSLMFAGMINITEIDLSGFDSEAVTDMRYMFLNCISLKSIKLDNFITTNVEYMEAMFANCISLTSLVISSFNTGNAIKLTRMFYNCHSLISLNLPDMTTTKVVNFNYMFFNCYSLKTLDLKRWSISQIRLIGCFAMFYNCTSLTSLDISNFDTTSVNMVGIFDSMFEGCKNLRYLNIANLYFIDGMGMQVIFSLGNIFKNTPENMVICLPVSNAYYLKKIFRNKTCGVITCDEDWEIKQKKINNETGVCKDRCDGEFSFEYNTQCYKECPKGTIFNETSKLCEEGEIIEEIIETDDSFFEEEKLHEEKNEIFPEESDKIFRKRNI